MLVIVDVNMKTKFICMDVSKGFGDTVYVQENKCFLTEMQALIQ